MHNRQVSPVEAGYNGKGGGGGGSITLTPVRRQQQRKDADGAEKK